MSPKTHLSTRSTLPVDDRGAAVVVLRYERRSAIVSELANWPLRLQVPEDKGFTTTARRRFHTRMMMDPNIDGLAPNFDMADRGAMLAWQERQRRQRSLRMLMM